MNLRYIIFSLISTISLPVFAQWQVENIECQNQILEAEKNRQTTLYSSCGFDDENTAFNSWAPWAKENKAYQALYEISQRFPKNIQSEELFLWAVEGKNGPALILQGDQFYQNQNYPQAINLYTQALNSPLLTLEEKGHITQNIGILYLNPTSSYYNVKKGLPLITKATEQRSALSNNIMGVYSLFGLDGTQTNEKESFFYFWRAILLGCPAAQENLGIYHLLHQKKITKKEAFKEMQNHIFSCAISPQKEEITSQKKDKTSPNLNCNCTQIKLRLQLINDSAEYQFISNKNNQNILKNKKGEKFFARVGLSLPDGSIVKEVHKTVVILSKNNEEQKYYLLPAQECIQFCQASSKSISAENQPVTKKIQAYHLTFTPQECSDILYYAENLVDTELPFIGKEECGFSGNLQIANQLLMQE